MRIKIKFYSTALVLILSVLLLLSVASAAQETRLSVDVGENEEPATYGDKVVWSIGDEIHIYDLKTEKDTTISMPANYSTEYFAVFPAIYGNKIVWYLSYPGNTAYNKLCVYDIPTSTTSLLPENASSWTRPDIYNNTVVWGDSTAICMYDIPTHTQVRLPINGSTTTITAPVIYGNKIVWDELINNGTRTDENNNTVLVSRSDIYMYDLSTKKVTQITNSGSAASPAIYGNRIVWQDWRNPNNYTDKQIVGDVYMYDLSTEKESRISYSGRSYRVSSPAIYGDRIVWTDLRNGLNIYMYDLSTQNETQITTSGYALDPKIYGNIIVDRDNRVVAPRGDGFCDIYMYNLSTSVGEEENKSKWLPISNFTSNVTVGYAPLSVQFTDSSENATSWNWDFGDGINSTEQNPMHTFYAAGNYSVNLVASNENGTASKNATVIVVSQDGTVGRPFLSG